MSRIFSDQDLLSWEAYASTGPFGLPQRPKVVFNCLSDPHRRARFVEHEGDRAVAERDVLELTEDRLREMLSEASEL